MTSTHRGLNRLLLGLVGLVILAVGAAVTATALLPGGATTWKDVTGQASERAHSALDSTPLPDGQTSWWSVGVLAAGLILIILLAAWIFSQGGGKTHRILREKDSSDAEGSTTVDTGFAAEAIKTALKEDPRILGTSVSSWDIKGTDGLKISIQARRGASPADITTTVERLLGGLDSLLGKTVPVLIYIGSGTRTNLARAQRTL